MHARNLTISAVFIAATFGLWTISSHIFASFIKPGDSFGMFMGVSIPDLVTFAPFLVGSFGIAFLGTELFKAKNRINYTYATIAICSVLFAYCKGIFIQSNWTGRIMTTEIVLTLIIAASGVILARYRMTKNES